MDTLAFLGTGLIGHAMVEAAVARGHRVSAWNRTAARAADLAALGVRVSATAAEAVVGASRIHIAMTDDVGVDAVLDQIRPDAGAIVLDHTTTSVPLTKARAARMAAAGIDFLHTPVFMSPASCRANAGLIVVAGPQLRYERVATGLAGMTGKVWYVGERPEAAAIYKLLGNAMLLTVCGGIADLFTLAHQGGLTPTEATELFAHFDPGGMIKARGARMASGDFSPSFLLTTAFKDLGLMVELANGAPLSALPGIGARMELAIAEGQGELDYGVISAPRFTGR